MNYLRRITLIFAIMAALFLLAACGGDEEETTEPTATAVAVEEATDEPAEPTEEPTEEPTLEPTEEPTAEPTPEPTAVPVVELDFTETSNEALGITFSYPSDWLVESDADGNLQIASDEALLGDDIEVEEGIKVLFISLLTADFAMLAGNEDASDPAVVLNIFSSLFTSMGSQDENMSLTLRDDVTETSVADYDAAVVVYDVAGEGLAGTAKLYAVADPDNGRTVIIVSVTPLTSEEEYLASFEQILDSITLFEPTAVETGLGDQTSQGFILPGDQVSGTLATEDAHIWEYIGLESEVLDIVVEPLDDLDVVVDIVAEDGTSIIGGEQDLEFGTETISALTIPTTGQYYIYVRGFAGATGDYTLTVTESGTSTDNGNSGTSEDVEIGTIVTGSLEGAEQALWTVTVEEGDFLDVIVTPYERLDVVVDILDANGDSLYDSETDATVGTEIMPANYFPEAGTYTILVYSFDGTGGEYDLDVSYTNNNETNTVFFVSQIEYDDAEAEHVFPFNALEGDYVTAIAEPSDIDFDLVIALYNDDTGELIDQVDASFGMEMLTYQVTEAGNYSFIITGYEGSVGVYDIILLGSEPVIYELAVNDEVFGKFGEQGYLQYYLGGEEGEVVTITVEASPDQDVVVYITDTDGNILQQADAAGTGGVELIEFTFGAEGLVIIELEDFGQTQETFTMYIED